MIVKYLIFECEILGQKDNLLVEERHLKEKGNKL